jgi:hypothetical protein
MKASYVFIVAAVLALVFGLAFVLVPAQTLALYDVTLNDAGLFIARLLGAAFLMFAVLAWLVRNAAPSAERQAITLAFFVSNTVAFVASLLAQLAGVANALGWTTVAIYLILALGFGYVRFMGEDAAARPQMAG